MINSGFATLIIKGRIMVSEQQMIQQATATERLIEELYEPAFFRVAKYISKAGGSFEDARDTFHDSLEIYFDRKHLQIAIASDVDYIVGIARHLWLNRVKREAGFVQLVDLDAPQIETPSADDQKLLLFLESTGKRCLDLLVSFYYEQMSIPKLMQKFGFTSEHSASVQKYKCIEKLREVVKSKCLNYADFFE